MATLQIDEADHTIEGLSEVGFVFGAYQIVYRSGAAAVWRLSS
jgi:hypothetical protein